MKTKVVPEPSERCTTAIPCDGNLTVGLSLRSAASFHDLISPRKILAKVGPSMVSSPRLDALEVHHRHDAADHGGKLHETVCLEIGLLERHVGGAEGHLIILDLPDPLARTDRLV